MERAKPYRKRLARPLVCSAAVAVSHRSTAVTGGRIMIVDDDVSFVEAVAIYLEDHGFKVLKATSAREGITASRRQKLDLAIVDVHLRDLEGTEVAGALRQWQPSTPVLFISSDDSPETSAKCLAAAHAFMSKPLIPNHLLETILQLCGGNAATNTGADGLKLAFSERVS